jgi:hypothetical protein
LNGLNSIDFLAGGLIFDINIFFIFLVYLTINSLLYYYWWVFINKIVNGDMNVIISEEQKERLKSVIIKLVEDLKVPLVSRIAVEIPNEKTIIVIIVLKDFVGFRIKEKYESLIHDRIKNYIGLKVDVLIFEKND